MGEHPCRVELRFSGEAGVVRDVGVRQSRDQRRQIDGGRHQPRERAPERDAAAQDVALDGEFDGRAAPGHGRLRQERQAEQRARVDVHQHVTRGLVVALRTRRSLVERVGYLGVDVAHGDAGLRCEQQARVPCATRRSGLHGHEQLAEHGHHHGADAA